MRREATPELYRYLNFGVVEGCARSEWIKGKNADNRTTGLKSLDVSPLSPVDFAVCGRSSIGVLVSREPRRFIRWEMDVEGIPVAQVATEAFEAGLAEAISLETGDYTDETSSVVVREA